MARREGPIDRTGDRIRLPWARSDRPIARRVLRPLQSFLEQEVAGGLLLLLAALVAITWSNSPWRGAYEDLWNTSFTLRLGAWVISDDLRHWVNDGLMTLFFLVVGLEIKREFLTGELRDHRAAALPVIAAVGGMLVPALLYVAINLGGVGARGWGIPMATDIAFALAVLTLAARHAPPALKPFLLTLAIVDDIGAILVIAVFYSGGVSLPALAAAGILCAAIVGLQRLQVRATPMYVVFGGAVWFALFRSGIHPTIAGVILGLLTPALPFQRPRAVSIEARRIADETMDEPSPPDADAHHWLHLAGLTRETVSPLARVESLLHPWTSFVIVPLFALANAGFRISGDSLREALTSPVSIGVLVGLVAGKIVGITLASWAAVKAGVGGLPAAVMWRDVVGMAAVAGIGFTVSLFVADLAFADPAVVDAAKIGILAASIIAGFIALAVFRGPREPGQESTDRSTRGAGDRDQDLDA